MPQSKKNILDFIRNILTRFKLTDDSRFDENVISYLIDQVRADLIVKQYIATNILDTTWLSDLGLVNFYRVNFADDNTITCNCDVAKATIPQIISLNNKNGNQDLGMYSVVSACGSKSLTSRRMFQWKYTPPEHTNSLFTYYWRINTQMYVSDPTITQLRIIPVLLHPEDGYLKNSSPVVSGSLVNGVVYTVRVNQIVYNATVYNINDIFTATSTTTYTGLGLVYLNSEIIAYRDIDAYPASAEMIRQIQLEILTKEFKIEAGEIPEIRNDSSDDSNKG
jgi:hypothetical protein